MKAVSWSKSIPFFRNTYLLRSLSLAYFTVMIIFAAIIAIIFIADGDADKLAGMVVPVLLVAIILFLLFWLGTWIAIGNRYALRYTLSDAGIEIRGTRDKARNIRKLAIAAGVLTANPGLVGAGLLVRDDIIKIPWNDIEDIEWDKKPKKIVIKCSFWNQVALHYPKAQEESLKHIIATYQKA